MKRKPGNQLENILRDIRGLSEAEEQDSLNRLTKKIKDEIQAVPAQLEPKETIPPKFVESLVNSFAYHFSQIRKLRTLLERPDLIESRFEGTEDDRLNDYIEGRALFSHMVLEGEMPFKRLDPETYKHLEGSWLRRVKQIKAYQIWNSNNQTGSAQDDFFAAAREVRRWLLHRPRAKITHFESVKDYLKRQYLTDAGLLDETKPGTHNLISNKAQRIWQTTGQPDSVLNWFRAKLYVTMFYESIMGAVIDNDERKTATILKAFEFSKSEENGYLIINAFEAAIAIEFLNKDIIKKLINHPYSFDFNLVPVESWPENLREPKLCEGRLKYLDDNKQLIYEGQMTEEERDQILSQLSDIGRRMSLEHLFALSRRKPLEEMIL